MFEKPPFVLHTESMKKIVIILTQALVLLNFATAAHYQKLQSSLPWYKDNQEKLNNLLEDLSKTSKQERKVAVFDWDNTVIKNDMGDATFFWMLKNDKILTPVSWEKTSPFLSTEALKELKANCSLNKKKTLLTSTSNLCTDTLLSIYEKEKLSDGKTPAWNKNYNPDLIIPGYSWIVHLMAGHTPDEIRHFAQQSLKKNLQNPIGSEEEVGSGKYVSYIRYYEQMKELIKNLQKNNFEVWIVSASVQYIVEIAAREAGVESSHVIGVRPKLDSHGKIAQSLEGCSNYPEGNQEIITYRQGKRCWINKIIFGVTDPHEQLNRPSPLAFAAGDSDTDVFFVKDAQVHLVINRNKEELMCHAYNNFDKRWIINPMFIEPKPQKSTPYSCKNYSLPETKDLVF